MEYIAQLHSIVAGMTDWGDLIVESTWRLFLTFILKMSKISFTSRDFLFDDRVDIFNVRALGHSDSKLIALTVLLFQMTGWTETNHFPIDHYGYAVTKGLSFFHAVSSYQYGWILMFQHLEKTATRKRIESCSWLIQKLDQGIAKEWDSAAQLSLVSTTQVFCFLVSEWR